MIFREAGDLRTLYGSLPAGNDSAGLLSYSTVQAVLEFE